MKKLLTLVLAATMVMSLSACGGSSETTTTTTESTTESTTTTTESTTSGETVTLKIGNAQASTHPWNVAIEQLIEKAAEYSDGRLVIENYSDATLGNEAELIEQVKEGTLDMCVIDPTVGSTYTTKLDLFALPFLFTDYDHWERALDGAAGQEYADIIEAETGIRMLAYWGGSTRNVISVGDAVESIDDLNGYKLRLVASELKFNVWSAVGCIPTEVAFSETYAALANKMCDGMENEDPSILSAKFYEVAPNLTETQHEITVRPLMINAEIFDGLDADLQEALSKAIDEITPIARELEAQAGQEARDTMVNDYGMTVTTIDKAPIVAAVTPVFQDFGVANGLEDLIAAFQAA